MQPHIGVVLRRDVVAPPLVRALVHDDEVPLQPEPGAGEVAPQIAVQVMVTVGDGALVLHTEVWRLDQLVAVGVPGIRPEPKLEAPQHRDDLFELAPSRVDVVGQRPEIE